jgi:hypothetical protein
MSWGRRRSRPGQIDARHHVAAQALAAGKNQDEAALEAGVSIRTLYGWTRNEPWFTDLVNSYALSITAAVRMQTSEGAVKSKLARLTVLEEVKEVAMKTMRESSKATDIAQAGRLAIDAVDQAAKELGELGKPLQAEDQQGNPVLNLEAGQVDPEEDSDAHNRT